LNSAKIVIRPAEAPDGERLLALIDALADYEHLPRPDGGARARLLEDAFGGKPRFTALLAEVDNQAVGYAIYLETYSSFLALPTLYLEDIFILPEHRRLKIGRRLFLCCVEEARRRNCGRMEWVVLDWNRPAQEFYEKMGARRLTEWWTYRLVREDMERLLG